MNDKMVIIFAVIQGVIFFSFLNSEINQSSSSEKSSLSGEAGVEQMLSKAENSLDTHPDSALFLAGQAYDLSVAAENENLLYRSSKLMADAYYYLDDLSQATNHYRIAADHALEIHGEMSTEYASRLSDIGFCYYKLDVFDLADEYFNKAYLLFKKMNDEAEMSNQLNNLGLVYFSWGKYNLAIEFLSRTLKYDLERGDSSALATSYNNIGKVYESWGYFDIAIEHYLKSMEYLDETDEARRSIRLSNIGTSYFEKGDFNKALSYLEQALDIDQQLQNASKMAIRLNEIAGVLDAQAKYREAIDHNKRALEILEGTGPRESQAIVLNDLGSNYAHTGNFERAKNYFERSISIAGEIGSASIEMAAYGNLAELYTNHEKFREALAYRELYTNLKDSIFNAETHKQLANYRIRYESEKKERENQLLRHNLLVKERTQRTLIIGGVLLAVSVLLLFFLLREKIRSLKQARKLHEQNQKLSSLEVEKAKVEQNHLQDKVFAEQQINKIQKEKFEAEIGSKNKELLGSTVQLVNKNEVLSELKNKIKTFDKVLPQPLYSELISLLNANTDFDQNWHRFKLDFENINPGFFDRLKLKYPDLSEQFVRLSALLRIDLSTREIAQFMNVSVAAVNKNRQRLRKRLNLEAEADLGVFMKHI